MHRPSRLCALVATPFAGNLQCEDAMLRRDCRTGGVRFTGYVTPAARYCKTTFDACATRR